MTFLTRSRIVSKHALIIRIVEIAIVTKQGVVTVAAVAACRSYYIMLSEIIYTAI